MRTLGEGVKYDAATREDMCTSADMQASWCSDHAVSLPHELHTSGAHELLDLRMDRLDQNRPVFCQVFRPRKKLLWCHQAGRDGDEVGEVSASEKHTEEEAVNACGAVAAAHVSTPWAADSQIRKQASKQTTGQCGMTCAI